MSGKSLEIRSLDGEAITLDLPPGTSVRELKSILGNSFPPARISPDFHLFFEGAKLSLEDQVGGLCSKNGAFVALVPFAKKSSRRVSSSAAESAWKDIRDDISNLSNRPLLSSSPSASADDNVCCFNPSLPSCTSKKRTLGLDKEAVIWEVLQSGVDGFFDEQNKDKIRQVAESVCCLSNDLLGGCFLWEELCKDSRERNQCVCPPWLRGLLKFFSLLNVLYAALQMQRKILNWDIVESVVKKAQSFGLDEISISDVKKLPDLLPKVFVIQDVEENAFQRSNRAIIITVGGEDGSIQCMHQKEKKRGTVTTMINCLEKRWTAFKNELRSSIKCFLDKSWSSKELPPKFTFEDVMIMKDNTISWQASQRKQGETKSIASACLDLNPLEPIEMVEHLKSGLGKFGQIVHVEELPAKSAVYVDLPVNLSEELRGVLKQIGISKLYNHQAEAIRHSLHGSNVVVATSTSSGKSLCYNIPVLESLTQNLSACALYVFPTKALAQDQLRTLLAMKKRMSVDLNVAVFDGDTSKSARSLAIDNARLLITNPDMLHHSILPLHSRFSRILSNLRFIVVDEAHAYKGAFGCHTALVLRRLLRICSSVYGSDPRYIFCTATLANPREHAIELANCENLELIQNDGSPCGSKYFLLWNPPFCSTKSLKTNFDKGSAKSTSSNLLRRRSSPILQVSYLFAEMIQHGLRCIAFCKTRKLCELVLSHTREILQVSANNLVDVVCVYRSGYIAQDRRKIEADLFDGKIRGVAATNALELGIDVGHIEATIHLGFPGSIASLWQQAGRAGRRAKPSLAIYVAFEGPLDQYFMKFPPKLFGAPIEHCQVDSRNQKVVEQHVACAAYEYPLCPEYDEKHFGSGLDSAIGSLNNKGHIAYKPNKSLPMWVYTGREEMPSRSVSIRAIEREKYTVVDKSNNEVLEEIEESKAFFQIYDGAVYLHQGVTYLVHDLNLSSKTAFCQKADLKYYTKTRDYTDVHVICGEFAYLPADGCNMQRVSTTAKESPCSVTTKWFGFYRICKFTNQILDTVELNLPTYSFDSQAAWIHVPHTLKLKVEDKGFLYRAGLHAASHALLNVVPLYMMCNVSDVGTECTNPHETRLRPERLLLYDQHPGGIGIASQIKLLFGELLIAACDLVSACSCSSVMGCPNCVQTLTCGEYNSVLDKEAAIFILKGVIEAERSHFQTAEKSSSHDKRH